MSKRTIVELIAGWLLFLPAWTLFAGWVSAPSDLMVFVGSLGMTGLVAFVIFTFAVIVKAGVKALIQYEKSHNTPKVQ